MHTQIKQLVQKRTNLLIIDSFHLVDKPFFARKHLLKRRRQTDQRTFGQLGLADSCSSPGGVRGRVPTVNAYLDAFTVLKTHLMATILKDSPSLLFFILFFQLFSRKHPASTCQWSGCPWS